MSWSFIGRPQFQMRSIVSLGKCLLGSSFVVSQLFEIFYPSISIFSQTSGSPCPAGSLKQLLADMRSAN